MDTEITAYVDWEGDLRVGDTNERLRRATPQERAESRAERTRTGMIAATVSVRTLRQRAPSYCALLNAYRGWDA